MKTASWILTPLLAGLLFYAFSLVPTDQQGLSPLSNHIVHRYEQRCSLETGIHSPVEAVLTDYRSFDLLALTILFSTAGLGILFFFPRCSALNTPFASFLWVALGTGSVLVLGFIGLKSGGNFLDYESLALWIEPHRVRWDAAVILLLGALLTFGGLLTLCLGWIRSPKDTRGN